MCELVVTLLMLPLWNSLSPFHFTWIMLVNMRYIMPKRISLRGIKRENEWAKTECFCEIFTLPYLSMYKPLWHNMAVLTMLEHRFSTINIPCFQMPNAINRSSHQLIHWTIVVSTDNWCSVRNYRTYSLIPCSSFTNNAIQFSCYIGQPCASYNRSREPFGWPTLGLILN